MELIMSKRKLLVQANNVNRPRVAAGVLEHWWENEDRGRKEMGGKEIITN